MKKYLDEALATGLVCPSSSPARAGFFFVSKKDGGLLPCIDNRGLNNIHLSFISSAFNLVQDSIIFTKLDLFNAYHFREGDEWKTAFTHTPIGHFEYLVMPVGLTNAPAVFQNLVNDVLVDMLNKFVFVYLDDILIYSRSETEHVLYYKDSYRTNCTSRQSNVYLINPLCLSWLSVVCRRVQRIQRDIPLKGNCKTVA